MISQVVLGVFVWLVAFIGLPLAIYYFVVNYGEFGLKEMNLDETENGGKSNIGRLAQITVAQINLLKLAAMFAVIITALILADQLL